MEEKIIRLVRERGHVSFLEIRDLFPSERGEISIAMPGYYNILYWWGLSEDLARAISNVLERQAVFVHPATPLTYAIDGVMTTMPLAKSVRQYKEPHWYPVTLHHTVYAEGV